MLTAAAFSMFAEKEDNRRAWSSALRNLGRRLEWGKLKWDELEAMKCSLWGKKARVAREQEGLVDEIELCVLAKALPFCQCCAGVSPEVHSWLTSLTREDMGLWLSSRTEMRIEDNVVEEGPPSFMQASFCKDGRMFLLRSLLSWSKVFFAQLNLERFFSRGFLKEVWTLMGKRSSQSLA